MPQLTEEERKRLCNVRLGAQGAMHLKVKKLLDVQLDRMTKARRKSALIIDKFDLTDHYLVACRESFVHYYSACKTADAAWASSKSWEDWHYNRKRYEKYDYACNYLSARMHRRDY